MSQLPSGIEFDRQFEVRQAAARRSILLFDGLWLVGSVAIMVAVSLLRNSVIESQAAPFALAPGWLMSGAGAAGAAFVVLRQWPVLPWTSVVVGLVPWGGICFAATMIIRGYLL